MSWAGLDDGDAGRSAEDFRVGTLLRLTTCVWPVKVWQAGYGRLDYAGLLFGEEGRNRPKTGSRVTDPWHGTSAILES